MKKVIILLIIIFSFGCRLKSIPQSEFFDEDLSGSRLSKEEINYSSFSERTIWPEDIIKEFEFDPYERLAWGTEPFLNLDKLHSKGITGKDVHVAVIDGAMNSDHDDFTSCLYSYQEINMYNPYKIHGTIVASILCGKRSGVAPEVKLHYYANTPAYQNDIYTSKISALKAISEYNKIADEKIKIISISIGEISGIPSYDLFIEEIEKLEQQGVMVFYVSMNPGIRASIRFPEMGDRNDISKYEKQLLYSGFKGTIAFITRLRKKIYLPCADFTVASFSNLDEYMYIGQSSWGNSWAVPIAAGLAALAIQVDSTITKNEVVDILYKTGERFYLGKIPNPESFIDEVVSRM